jgi:hypothetical protein
VNKVILNWQRPPWEGDQEVVKRSSRDEPVWVVIHMHGSSVGRGERGDKGGGTNNVYTCK